jgi:hypothetical protein
MMIDPTDAVRRYIAVLIDPSAERLDALDEVLAHDVVVVGLVGAGTGRRTVGEALASPRMPGLLSSAEWSEPTVEGDVATVVGRLPVEKPLGGLSIWVFFNATGQIARVEQQMIPAPPPPATNLMLSDDIKSAVRGALLNGTPVVVAYVDAQGAPHLSLRGSTQPYSDTQLAIWVRDPEGGLLKAIATNPNVALFYRDGAKQTTYQFLGRAHTETAPAIREAVYANTLEPERNTDARRRGVPVIIDLDRVEGMGSGGRFRMERR